jgi:anthranilate synthase/aminodeoxychorismate synthase-like glutamine amidotransferase
VSSEHRIVIIDNYDSYVYNLYQGLGELTGAAAIVYRNDEVTLHEVLAAAPTHIVISPGPGTPEDSAYFGVCRDLILRIPPTIPLLGVCLGHQGIGHAFGGKVIRADRVMHGKTSLVLHDGKTVFEHVENPFTAMRYHSLVIDPGTFPTALRVTARTDDGVIMAVEHRTRPIYGVQFHPESIGTPAGQNILSNFLECVFTHRDHRTAAS